MVPLLAEAASGNVWEQRRRRRVLAVWCSRCGAEYEPGFERCAECDVQLVAAAAGFGDVIASGAYTTAILTLLFMRAREQAGNHAVIAVLGVHNQMPNPVRAGDVLGFDAEIVAKRESRSRAGTGVVTTRARLTNQDGAVVLDSETVTLVQCRGG